jgi:hypothetical protein
MPFLSGVLAVKDSGGIPLGGSRSVALKIGDGLQCTVTENGEISDLTLAVAEAPIASSYVCKAVQYRNIPKGMTQYPVLTDAWVPYVDNADDIVDWTAGEIVLLIGQTDYPETNGPYVVGGTAPTYTLTRPAWWRYPAIASVGVLFHILQGTQFQGTTWRSMATASQYSIDTDDPRLMPQSYQIRPFTVSGPTDITPAWYGTISAVDVEYLSGDAVLVQTSRPSYDTLRFTAATGNPHIQATVRNWSYRGSPS